MEMKMFKKFLIISVISTLTFCAPDDEQVKNSVEMSQHPESQPDYKARQGKKSWATACCSTLGSSLKSCGSKTTSCMVGCCNSISTGYKKSKQGTFKLLNKVFRYKAVREGTEFTTKCAFAVVMRHYFGDEVGIVPQINFARCGAKYLARIPLPNRVPLKSLIRSGAVFGLSYGFEALDEMITKLDGTEGFETNLGAVCIFIAVFNLSNAMDEWTKETNQNAETAPL